MFAFLFDIPTKNKTTATVIITEGTIYKNIGAGFNTKLATSKQPKLGNNITKDRMNVLYKALGDFLSQQKRLPCPASILVPRGGANYGKEVRDGNYCRGLTEVTPKGIYLSNINTWGFRNK